MFIKIKINLFNKENCFKGFNKYLKEYRFKEEVKDIFYHIMQEEKEHVEELTKALVILDKDAYGPIKFGE